MDDLVAPGRQPGRAEARSASRIRALIDAFAAAVASGSARRMTLATLRTLDSRATPASTPQLRRAARLVGRDRRARSSRASRRSSPTCAARGDAAVLEYTRPLRPASTPRSVAALEIGARRTRSAALAGLPAAQRDALEAAAARVRDYHERQLEACGRSLDATATPTAPARPEGHAARPRRHLRAGRQGGVSVVAC